MNSSLSYEIESHVGAGPVRFGMPASAVRGLLEEEPTPVDKSLNGVPVDYFSASGIFVYYDEGGLCEAVEFSGPASPTWKSRPMLGQVYREVSAWILQEDPQALRRDDGLISMKLGLGFFVPLAASNNDAPVKGVIVFAAGYYKHVHLS
jgi:hypothetical protein